MNPITIREDGKIIESILLDRQEVGTSFTKTYQLYNKSIWAVQLSISNRDEDVTLKYPSMMIGSEINTLIVEFTPKLTRRVPLIDEIIIKGVELIG